MRVKEIMNDVEAVNSNFTLKEAAKIMASEDIGSLVVMEKGKIAGIITERDIIRNVSDIKKKISAVMTKQVVTIDSNENVNNAAEVMAEHKIKHLPVLGKKGEIAGIITQTDLIANCEDLNEDFFLD